MKLIIHAPNVHQGGGKALLSGLLQSLANGLDCELLCDARLEGPPLAANIKVTRCPPSIAGRWGAERHLSTVAAKDDVVLCMGNLPPLFALPSRTCLFLQNRYLCEPAPLGSFETAARLRITAERFWLRHFLRNVSRVIVQTPSMRESVLRNLGADAAVMPFAAAPGAIARAGVGSRLGEKRFLYPASAEPHKNHGRLIEAWRLLHASGAGPELHLTVPSRALLAREIEHLSTHEGLPVVNHGEVDASRLGELYALADALIFPSTLESFGLPLVEARAIGLPIIAAELDYVRDLVDPVQTFDPASAVSIARAVRRFIGAAEIPASIMSPAEFIQRLISGQV